MKAIVMMRGKPGAHAFDLPKPGLSQPDEVLVRVKEAGVDGTDYNMVKYSLQDIAEGRNEIVMGHEMVGRICHVGSGVTGFGVGDRITLATTLACGLCAYCGRGLGNMCPHAKPISKEYDGAFAAKIAIPPLAVAEGNVIRVPDAVEDEAATLAEPLSCVLNAQEIAGVKPGDRVLIVGGGPLGALHAEAAKAAGAERVMIVQRSEPRLSLLRKLRDVTVIDGANEDVPARVADHTEGLGADVVIVCAPTREAHEQAPDLVCKGGVVSLFASLPKSDSEVTWDSRTLHYGELRVVGASDSRPEHVEKAVRLLADGKIDVAAVITHRVPLDRIHDGLELMKQKQSLKVIVETGGA